MKQCTQTRIHTVMTLTIVVSISMLAWSWMAPSAPSRDADPQAWVANLKLSPWASVGGCGAGGSGGGASDGIKWVGQGVSGGLVQVEAWTKLSAGQNFRALNMPIRFGFKPMWNADLGLTLPFQTKTSEVQYRTNQSPNDRTTGGLGDVALDFTWSLGESGQYGLTLGQSLPTGQYDIVRGPDAARELLPASLQKGSGLYSTSLSLSWTRDIDKGVWIHGLSFSFPWITRFMTGKNEYMDSWFTQYRSMRDKRFYYDWKFYGENDLGDYTPPSISLSTHYGYRGVPGMVHSFGVSFGVPLGVAWIHSEKVGVYDPRPDPDHKAWNAAFVYGAEFSRDDFPIFIAMSIPIHDKSNAPGPNEYDPKPMQAWDGPDWKDVLQQWTVALGFKTTFW